MKLKHFIFAFLAMLSFSFSVFAQSTVSSEADLKTALENGGEVTLDASITVSAPVTIPSGSEVVLNLNGKTLKATNAKTKVLENQGNLTINGQGTVSGVIYNGTANNSTAQMTLNGGTYSLDGNNGGLHHYGKTLTINDGVVVKTTSYGVRMAGEKSVLNLYGGTYTSTGSGDMARPLALSYGTVNFLDKDITVNGYMHVMIGQVTVNFGENNQYSPFEAYHQGNNYASSAFYCTTLAEAIKRTSFPAVTLVKNVKVAADAPITVNKEINLNLNGKNISATNARTTVLKNYANLTIKGKGTVTGLVYNGDGDNKGVAEMTLNGGTYKLDGANGGFFNYGKTLTVNDGVTISSQVYGLRMSNAASVINLNGGTFTSTNTTDNMKRAIQVDAGTINFNDDDITINGYLHANRSKATVNFGEYCPFDAFMYATTNASGYYVENLENAIAKAEAGYEIVLQKNLERSDIVTLSKKLTLDGNGKTLTSTAGRAINVDCEDVVTIENLIIAGATGCERGINIINKAGTTNLKKVNVSGVSHYAVHVATSAGAAQVNIENSNLNGWAAVAAYGEGGTVNVKNSNLVGVNNYTGNSDDFATIAAGSNVTINVTGGKVTAEGIEGKAAQTVVCAQASVENAKFTLDAELELKGTAEYVNINLDKNAVAVREAYAVGFVTTPAGNGLVTLTGASEAQIGDVKYSTLAQAFAAAKEGETITLISNATPALTSQRAITKAAIIDLNGKTLTLTEDDLYFGTTKFQNGTIVVDPSVKVSTAVFWMFANQTLTFDNVKVVATGVTGTYLIGLDGNNSDLNLLNGSEILVENTTALDLDIICVNASTGNDIKVENSKVNVKNLDGRVFFRGNYTVKDSEVNLAGITKAGFRIEAGQTLSIEGTSKVNIEGEPRDGGINLIGATASYTKAESATVNATVTETGFEAKIGDAKYATFNEAVAAAQSGAEVTIFKAGTYKVPTGKDLTITGAVEGVKFANIGAHNMGGASMTFNNVTFEYGNENYKGLQHAGNLIYNNCTFNGQVFLYGQSETFNYCIFNQTSADAYNVWTYGAKEVAFNECTFNSAGKSVLIYHENAAMFNNVAVTKSTFKASQAVDGKAAIEMDASLTAGINLTIDAATTATGFANGNVSGNSLWNNKKGNADAANNDITVKVGDDIVLAPVYEAKIGEKGYRKLQDAINAVQNGETVYIVSDFTGNITLTEKEGLHYTLDGNGKQFNGSISVNSLSDTNDNRRITIKHIDFVDETAAAVDFISSVNTNHYPRLTIEECSFTGSGDATDVAVRLKSSHSVVIKNCVGTGLHSFLQNTSGWNLTIENVKVTESKGAFALGTVQGVTVKGSNIDVEGYGIRLDAGYNNNAVIESNEVTACIPVVVRKVTANSNVTFAGENTFNADNEAGKWMVIGSTEYEGGVALPTETATNVVVTLNDAGLSYAGIHGAGLAGKGTAEAPYLINNVAELEIFRNSVNAGSAKYSKPGLCVALNADIDMTGLNWVGIGTATADHGFMGNFDGKGFKFMNLTITDPALDSDDYAYAGLFGVTEGIDKDNQNVIKNLIIENVTINTTGHIAAAAIAYPYYTILENIKVRGNIAIKGGDYTAGALAYTRRCVNASNIAVEGAEGSYITGNQVVGGVISDIQMNGGLKAEYSNFSASGVTVTGQMNVGGISGIIATQTLNGASVANVKLVSNDDVRVGVVSGSLGGVSTISNVTVDNVEGATAIVGATYDGAPVEARIGDTYYGTLAKALAAEGDEDVVLFTPITVAAGTELVLDLNGKTVYHEMACTASYQMVYNKGNLTIKNGTLRFKDTSAGDPSFRWGSYTVRNEGTLVVEDATIEHLGAQAFATHCIMALYQYSGSTTINGGTISTPNYRSARLWKGDMTINGGTFDGQVWVQAVDNSAKLTINGGTFEPNGNDASAVFVTNDQYNVALAVTGGTFNGKIGCSDATKLAGAITGGSFSATAKQGTNSDLIATGYMYTEAADANGFYSIIDNPVTHYINNVEEFVAFRDAVNAGNDFAGVTVYLTADIDLAEIDWSVNIGDDAGATFDGTFDGQNHKIMNLKSAETAQKSDGYICTGLFGAIHGNAVLKDFTIENVEINTGDFTGNNVAAVVGFAYSVTGSIENVKVTGDIKINAANVVGVGTIIGYDYYSPALTVKNCSVIGNTGSAILGKSYVGGAVGYASSKIVLAENTVENVSVTATASVGAIAGIMLGGSSAADNTVKNVALTSTGEMWANSAAVVAGTITGGTITVANTTVENVTANGAVASIVGGQLVEKPTTPIAKVEARIGNTYYKTFAAAFTAAEAGETITLLADVTVDNNETYWITQSLTIEGNYHSITSNANRIFRLNANDIEVTLNNVDMVNNAERVGTNDIRGISIDPNLRNVKLTLNNCSVDFTDASACDWSYAVNVSGNGTGHIVTIDGGSYEGANVINAHGANNTVIVNNATLTSLYRANEVYYGVCIWVLQNQGSSVEATGNTFNGAHAVPFSLGTGTVLTESNNTDNTELYIIKVADKFYHTLAEAVAEAEDGALVKQIFRDGVGAGVVIDKNLIIDFNGFTYSFNKGVGDVPSNGFQILKNNNVTLKNGTLNVAPEAANKFYILVQNYANLTVEGMRLEGENLDKWANDADQETNGDSYVLSNNSGTVVIKDYVVDGVVVRNTDIIANLDGSKAFAFDVCKYASYDAPTVTVSSTGLIEGKIEVSEGLEDNLVISGLGAYYTENVDQYCVEGMVCDKTSDDYYTIITGYRFVDGEFTEYTLESDQEVDLVSYSRNLVDGQWNPIYLPFEVPMEQLIDNYDVAYFNDVRSTDKNNDGVITLEEMEVEVVIIRDGTSILNAFYPYLIRVKKDNPNSDQANKLFIEVKSKNENDKIMLYAPNEDNENTLSCSSVFTEITIKGNASFMTGDAINGHYALGKTGLWNHCTKESKLKPFRLYLTITSKEGSPVKVQLPSPSSLTNEHPGVTVSVRGAGDGEANGIENSKFQVVVNDSKFYDLMGRIIEHPVKGHIYIVNGKKIVY